jgi:Holliday junction DNA helicase RuvA
MIGSLRGTFVGRPGETEVLLEVGGVGYRLTASTATVVSLGSIGEPAHLYVHTHVREDAIVLFGFAHDDERRCFEVLLGAHGVGPALALAILSQLSPAALTTALLEEDVNALCAVPGVGRKTAARLLIDLRSRLELPDLSPGGPISASSEAGVVRAEVRAALADLGYGPDEIRGALDRVAADDSEECVEDLLRGALRELASR